MRVLCYVLIMPDATVGVATKVNVSDVPTNVELKHPKYALGLWSP